MTNDFKPDVLVSKVMRDFNFKNLPPGLDRWEVEDLTRYLLESALTMAQENPEEYVEVREDHWVAQALVSEEGNLLSLIYAEEYATARYLDGVYI